MLLFLIGLTFFYVSTGSFSFTVNSDNMYFIRAAEDQLAGNPLLAGWHGGYFTALTTDLLVSALFRLLVSRKITLYLIGPLFCAFIALLSLIFFLSQTEKLPRKTRFIGGLGLSLSILLPAALHHSLFTVGMHNISIFIILLLLVLLAVLTSEKQTNARWVRWQLGIYAILLWAGVTGDGYVLYFFAIPAAITTGLGYLQTGKRPYLRLSQATIIAIASGIITIRLINMLGFLQTNATTNHLIPIAQIFRYIANAWNTWMILFGATSQWNTAIQMIGIITGVLAACCVIFQTIRFFKNTIAMQTLTLLTLFCIGSFTITDITLCEPAVRYMMPAFFGSILLAALQFAEWANETHKPVRLFAFASAILILISAVTHYPFHLRTAPINNQALIEIADSLKDRRITTIYATYLETHALDYYSDGKIQAAPITAENGKITPYLWSSKIDWYQSAYPANAIVISENKTYGITEEMILANFGHYDTHYELGGTNIYLFDHPISTVLEDRIAPQP